METRRKQYTTENQRRTAQEQTLHRIRGVESTNVQRKSDNDENIEKLYTDVRSIPNYSSKIANFLRQNENYSVHRRIVKKVFPRRKIITQYPFQIFQADLIEYPRSDYTYANRGHRFILVVIDCFTKMLYAEPVKRKSSEYMASAFESILNKFDFFPNSIITDKGLEFYNSSVQKVFQSYGINHYHMKTKTKWKTPMAERVIRTIKTRLERYMYQHKTKCWIEFLPQLVKNYNRTPHRSIGMAPSSVTFQNSEEVYKKMFGDTNLKTVPRLTVNDRVRKLIDKSLFDKGYKQNWSTEIYTIKSVIQKSGIVWYKLKGLDDKTLPGIYYYYQLNLVSRNVSGD